VTYVAHQEKIGRAGEDETPGFARAVPVHGPLDGEDEVRLALDLVDGQLWRAVKELVRGDGGALPG